MTSNTEEDGQAVGRYAAFIAAVAAYGFSWSLYHDLGPVHGAGTAVILGVVGVLFVAGFASLRKIVTRGGRSAR
jgi:hypothetical protein